MVKLVDTPDLGSGAVRCVGSSPILGTLPNVLSEMPKRSAFLFSLLESTFLNKNTQWTLLGDFVKFS
ncbi:MAG: hypothetical protein S4CHLAM123_10150 [Chlamydiales bacterium]|nr:hypothetical protein [Chlamydiales bacterium]